MGRRRRSRGTRRSLGRGGNAGGGAAEGGGGAEAEGKGEEGSGDEKEAAGGATGRTVGPGPADRMTPTASTKAATVGYMVSSWRTREAKASSWAWEDQGVPWSTWAHTEP